MQLSGISGSMPEEEHYVVDYSTRQLVLRDALSGRSIAIYKLTVRPGQFFGEHRYRASAGERAINELKPILGIEVTATPKTVGTGSRPFRNVIYDYDLPEAMEDGYVKEPAVGTRANFDPKSVSEDVLERIKLEDGVHYHEYVKVQLQTYARQHEVKQVHPFMLVVATDIQHAERLKAFIESRDFFKGRYAGKVITVHSGQSGIVSDDVAH